MFRMKDPPSKSARVSFRPCRESGRSARPATQQQTVHPLCRHTCSQLPQICLLPIKRNFFFFICQICARNSFYSLSWLKAAHLKPFFSAHDLDVCQKFFEQMRRPDTKQVRCVYTLSTALCYTSWGSAFIGEPVLIGAGVHFCIFQHCGNCAGGNQPIMRV